MERPKFRGCGSTCTLTWNVPANQPIGNYTLNVRVTDANGQIANTARVITLNPAAKITYYHTDPLGSPVLATDAAGNAVWREGYGAFGERLKRPAAADNVGYTGKQHDNASGLSYFGARWYDPAIGRFMGYDPAGFDEGNPGSFNRYGYGNNNPYKFVDPDGRLPVIAYAAIVYAPEIAAAVGAGFAAMRAAPALARFTASGLNTLTQISNSPTTHAVVEAAAGLASGVPGATSGVAAAGSRVANSGKFMSDVANGRGNFGLGTATAKEALDLGKSWVGPGYSVGTTNGGGLRLLSKDGLRQFRAPAAKESELAITGQQANFESRATASGRMTNNGHLDIVKE